MKTAFLPFALLFTAVLLSGCVVSSVNPAFLPTDTLYSRPAEVYGEWAVVDKEGKPTGTIIEFSPNRIVRRDGEYREDYDVNWFVLQNGEEWQILGDVLVHRDDDTDRYVHAVIRARGDFGAEQITVMDIDELNYDWMAEALEDSRVTLPHEPFYYDEFGADFIVFTCPSSEIQNLYRQLGSLNEAWWTSRLVRK